MSTVHSQAREFSLTACLLPHVKLQHLVEVGILCLHQLILLMLLQREPIPGPTSTGGLQRSVFPSRQYFNV